jgi:hypothetical protein
MVCMKAQILLVAFAGIDAVSLVVVAAMRLLLTLGYP